MPLEHKDKDQSGESGALQASVDRLSSMSLVSVAVDVMARALTGGASV
jgi:hypothetical protein